MDASDDYYRAMQQNQGWQQILASFARFVGPAPGSRLLDVGTGPGALVDMFQKDFAAQAFGLDASLELARSAQQQYAANGAGFIVGRLPTLPFKTGALDIVTATNVLYLLPEPYSALTEIARLLPGGGTFAMLNPSSKMNVATATALATERGLTGFARDNFIDWGRIAEAHQRWTLQEIHDMFAPVGLELATHRERIGIGLALYVKAVKL